MKNLTIIQPRENEDGTEEAIEIVAGRKFALLSWWNLEEHYGFVEVDEETKFIVFDDFREDMIPRVFKLFKQELLTINRMAGLTTRVQMPNIIIILNKD